MAVEAPSLAPCAAAADACEIPSGSKCRLCGLLGGTHSDGCETHRYIGRAGCKLRLAPGYVRLYLQTVDEIPGRKPGTTPKSVPRPVVVEQGVVRPLSVFSMANALRYARELCEELGTDPHPLVGWPVVWGVKMVAFL